MSGGPTHFVCDPVVFRTVHPCRADGSRERAPMRAWGAPPVNTHLWTPDDFARWEASTRASHTAFDAWHEVWGPRDAWSVPRELILPRKV